LSSDQNQKKDTGAMAPRDADPWGYRDRRCVVTGAASGMGAATCEQLVALGAEVLAIDVQPVKTEGVAASHAIDLSDPASIDRALPLLGSRVDALFNCAGIPGTAEPSLLMAVNFAGMRHLTESLIPSMPEGSAICNVGSTAAINWTYNIEKLIEVLGIADFAETVDWLVGQIGSLGYPYDLSKEAVNAYTAWRASTLIVERGVRLNITNPSATRTPASREFTKAVLTKDHGAEMLEHWPKLMGRMARTDEQAWPMIFLNSPFASFVNGTNLSVDGGLTGGLQALQHHPAVAAGMSWHPPK
jgi:NAD(P)-dependent dehydrogenase (short-subunit alcohol dehydrogenase family)